MANLFKHLGSAAPAVLEIENDVVRPITKAVFALGTTQDQARSSKSNVCAAR
jgi:hypothetical protein